MRRFLVLLCSLMLSVPAFACRGLSLSQTLFAGAITQPPLDADVIVKVDLLDVREGTATAKVLKVLKAPQPPIHQDSTVTLKYHYNSCGPDHSPHEQGIIIAKAGKDQAGRDVLYPYTYRRDGKHVFPPRMDRHVGLQ